MTKFYLIIFIAFTLSGCDAASDCLKSSGDMTTVVLETENFSALEINADLKVVIQEGPEQKVLLTTGENLIDGIRYEVIDGSFVIRNGNSCQWTRSYDLPVLSVTHPNLREIRQGGSGTIISKGLLHYPDLYLVSIDRSGDFDLDLSCERLTISNNDLSNFYISGESDYLKIGFYSGDGRFEGAGFKVKKAEIYHRGSNDMIIHATEELTGRIRSTGNIIYVQSKPAVIDIRLENIGKLIDRTE